MVIVPDLYKLKLTCQKTLQVQKGSEENDRQKEAWFFRMIFCAQQPSLDRLGIRRFFPKTTVPAATEGHPTNFKTVDATFGWASVFLKRLAGFYTTEFLCKKLRGWKWRLTTCFSGVGCAEMVLSLHFILL